MISAPVYRGLLAEQKVARAHLLTAEKSTIQRAIGEGIISLHTGEEMMAKTDDELDKIQGTGH